jgi:hypothetical protein
MAPLSTVGGRIGMGYFGDFNVEKKARTLRNCLSSGKPIQRGKMRAAIAK